MSKDKTDEEAQKGQAEEAKKAEEEAKKAEEAKVTKTTEKAKRGPNKPKTAKYELLARKTYISQGQGIKRLDKGSILELTEKQANSFKFKGKLKKVG